MRLPIVVLLGVVAVSTVRAQKHDDRYCDFEGVCDPPDPPCGGEDSFECRSAIPKGLVPISDNNAAKEQEAVDNLAAIGLLNAISEVAENSPPEQTRVDLSGLSSIIRRAKNRAKDVIRRSKRRASKFYDSNGRPKCPPFKCLRLKLRKCRPGSCRPGCPRRFCNRPRPRPFEPSYDPEPPAYIDGADVGQLTEPYAYGGYEARPRVQTFYVN